MCPKTRETEYMKMITLPKLRDALLEHATRFAYRLRSPRGHACRSSEWSDQLTATKEAGQSADHQPVVAVGTLAQFEKRMLAGRIRDAEHGCARTAV